MIKYVILFLPPVLNIILPQYGTHGIKRYNIGEKILRTLLTTNISDHNISGEEVEILTRMGTKHLASIMYANFLLSCIAKFAIWKNVKNTFKKKGLK